MNNTLTQSERSNKSTHTGTCQACGRKQKLPSGMLAKHGYTIEWGFFNGTCPGSHHLPFEKSCALIQSFIDSARAQLATVKTNQEALRSTPVTTGKAWVHDYNSNGRKHGYIWREVDITETAHSNGDGIDKYEWTEYSYTSITRDEYRRLDFYSNTPADLADACLKLNRVYAASFDKRIADLERYIKWQNERVALWVESDLTPIK